MLILCLLLAGGTCIFASSYADTSQTALVDSETGKTKIYKTANLLLNGKHVITDVPAILYVQDGSSRTLVPIRFITENIGAAVTWDNDLKEATIVMDEKTIVLKANSSSALVDGVPYTLPNEVPVKLMGVGTDYRTLVPIRFVSEQLGLNVDWMQDTRTVTISKPIMSVKSVVFTDNPDHPELVFKTTGDVAFAIESLPAKEAGGPERLILDMGNTLFDLDDKATVNSNGSSHMVIETADIRAVDGFQLEVVPYRTRFIVSMDKRMSYKDEYDPETNEIRIVFTEIEEVKPESDVDMDTELDTDINADSDEEDETVIPVVAEIKPGTKTVVIDAGHGGKDPGATSPFSQVKEKDLNLILAQKLKPKLEYIGINAVLTRSNDTYIGLYDRPAIANSLNADAFLSIHFNANTRPAPYGVEMLYVPDGRNSKAFAQILETEIVKATGAYSRGLTERPNLVVIRETVMPAVLAELGFLTNPGEEKLLLNEAYQDKLVEGMYNAIIRYLGSVNDI